MTIRTRPMSAAAVQQRAQQARAFMAIADLALSDLSTAGQTNVAGSNAVLAGIAAADAICGRTLGQRSASDNHSDGVTLLQQATPPGSQAVTNLRKLLVSKTDTQYSPDLISAATARHLVVAAQRLLEDMEKALRA